MLSKRKAKARGRPPAEPQLDGGDDTDHGSVVSATGKKKVKVFAELSREEEQQMVERLLNGLKNTLSRTIRRLQVCSYTLQ